MTDTDFYRIAEELGCKRSSGSDSAEGICSPYSPNHVFASYNYYGKFVHFWYGDFDIETADLLRNAIIGHLKIEKELCEAKQLDNIKKDFDD
jgi:hypothetical protein